MAKMTEKDLLGVLNRHIDASNWTNDVSLRQFQQSAMNAYNGGRPKKETDGLSVAVSSDFADMIESTTSAILPAFDFETIALYSPHSAEDVDGARIESHIANGILSARAGYTVIQEAIRNCLMLRNCMVKVFTERRVDVQTRRYKNLGVLELESVSTPNQENQEVVVTSVSEGDTENALNVSVTRTTRYKRLEIKSVDPIEFYNTENWDQNDLKDVPFCGEHYYLTRSDLLAMGVSNRKINKMSQADGANTTNLAWNARNRSPERSGPFVDNGFGDESMRLYETFENYILVDFDGDGFAERRRVVKAGGVIIQNEQFPHVPYASGAVFLAPQRYMAISLWDKLAELQAEKTEVLRQYFDNMAYSNNSELLVVDGAVELDDLKARRPGGINRVDDINAVRDLKVSDLGPSSLAMIAYLDRVRAERAGSSLDQQSAEGQIAAETAHGSERNYTALEALSRLMTKTFSETCIRQLFLLIHQTLRFDFPEGGMAQLGGREFIPYTPSDWPARLDVTIIAGMSLHERMERRNALEAVLIQQEKLQQAGLGGGILADLRTYHDALSDWTAAGGIRSTGRYWIDPRSEESIKAQQQASEQAQAQAVKQEGLQMAFAASEAQAQHGRNVGEFINDQAQLRFDYWKGTLDSAVEELKIAAKVGENGAAEKVEELQEGGAERSGVDIETD